MALLATTTNPQSARKELAVVASRSAERMELGDSQMPSVRTTAQSGFAALMLSSLVLTACSSGSASSSVAPTATSQGTVSLGFTPGTKTNPRVIVITADDSLMFMPMQVTVAKGETVTFQVKNVGKLEHEFMIGAMADAFADKEGTPEIAGITGGTSKSITFAFDGPGPYAFACHAQGHFEAGMKGTITIVGG
jgi:uncharacterized cupredoxin-like copper-binding protein